MIYRYFKCTCGTTFNAFVESNSVDEKGDLVATCSCGKVAKESWNDPKAVGTKMLFNYMER